MELAAAPLQAALERHELVFLGVTTPGYDRAYARFRQWIAEQKHAGMTFLEDHSAIRENPEQLLPGSLSVAAFALPYFHSPTNSPAVARYAHFADYHKLLRTRAAAAVAEAYPQLSPDQFRVVVDSAPLLERAQVARLPEVFVGKNTCLIHAKRGSFLLLGEIFFTVPLPLQTTPEFDSSNRRDGLGCGPCTSCQVACPTGALDEAFRIDSAKCLAYWTIEHRGAVPQIYWKWFDKFWYGCDLCQTACPYNTYAVGNELPPSIARREIPPLPQVAMMTQTQYETYFGGTPMTRAKRSGLRRNALIAMAVTQHAETTLVLKAWETEADPVLVETARQVRDYLTLNEGSLRH